MARIGHNGSRYFPFLMSPIIKVSRIPQRSSSPIPYVANIGNLTTSWIIQCLNNSQQTAPHLSQVKVLRQREWDQTDRVSSLVWKVCTLDRICSPWLVSYTADVQSLKHLFRMGSVFRKLLYCLLFSWDLEFGKIVQRSSMINLNNKTKVILRILTLVKRGKHRLSSSHFQTMPIRVRKSSSVLFCHLWISRSK